MEDFKLPYRKEYPDFEGGISLIPEGDEIVVATLWTVDTLKVTVRLASHEEAERLAEEFADPDGELAYEEGNVMGNPDYPDLLQFRP